MVNYKLHLPKCSLFYTDSEGTNRTTWFDHWTTITANENATDSEIIRLGKDNLVKQIARDELFDIRLYKTIGLENDQIVVVRP